MLQFRILGSFEVADGERPLKLGGHKQQSLLAVLLLHRGEVVSSDRLIEELWGERAPATAAKTVQVYISNLRKALGDGLLVTRGRGYLLAPVPEQIDAERFRALALEGHRALEAGDARVARERLVQADSLWRGPALADFAYEQFAQSEIARLEEARLAALEDRIDAELVLGDGGALVSELEALVREHPLRERLLGQLMRALYRSGRQADALERYQQARRKLIDELGIEPGPELQELERAILNHDPALGAGRHPMRSPSRPPVPRRLVPVLAVGGVLLVAAAVGAVLEMLGGGGATLAGVSNPGRLRTIASGRCSGLQYGGAGSPQLLVAVDLPLQPGLLDTTTPMVNAITLALERRGYRAGQYRVGLQVCDDATPTNIGFDVKTCSANAREYIGDPSVIGVVGPFSSVCATFEIPVLNGAKGGPLSIVGPSTTYVGLTRPAGSSDPSEPGVYYPVGRRNFARVTPADDVQAAGDAIAARSLGVKRVYALDDGSPPSRLFGDYFVRAVRRLGVTVAGRGFWDAGPGGYAKLANAIARTGADGVFLGVNSFPSSVRLLRNLRERLGRRVQLLAPDVFDPATAVLAGPAAEGMTLSQPGPPNDHLGDRGRQFVASFAKKFGAAPTRFAVASAQAMDILLDAIARSDGSRASVTRNLLTTRISNGILGSFWITPTGDTTLNTVAIYRIIGGKVTTFRTVVVPDALLGPN